MGKVRMTALVVSVAGLMAHAAGAGAATLEPIAAASYDSPTYVTSDPRDPNRLFITELPGTIRVTTGAGTELFLDLTDEVLDTGGEQGLWSMAFAPDFASSGLFYVAYSADPPGATPNGAITVDEYRERATPAETEATRREVLAIANDPNTDFHNGGQLQFGPDGYLYWSVGDDYHEANAQITTNVFGKLLRIDPRGSGPGEYSIPPDNPFAGPGPPLDEIWAYGLRNPWRFSFDRLTGALVIGDVGWGQREEVDYATRASGGGRALNYGWPDCEGNFLSGCANPGFTAPIYTYSHSGTNCAIMGGYVVRDPDLADLYGRYLFTDTCAGDLRSIDPGVLTPQDGHRREGLAVQTPVSFGEDACGRLYVVAQGGGGRVFRIEGPSGGNCPDGTPAPPDTDPPSTEIALRRKSKRSPKATYSLTSDEPGATFQCRLDDRKLKPCEPHGKLKRLRKGRHAFTAVATDLAGNVDQSPAQAKFKVKAKRKR